MEVKWFTKDIIKHEFRKFKTIGIFGNDIRTNFINMYMANNEQNHLVKYIMKFKNKKKTQHNSILKKLKEDILNSSIALLRGREWCYKKMVL